MKALALLILLLFPALALAQQQFYGTAATAVLLPAPADPADLPRLKVHSGEIITPDNVRSSIQALYDTGHYREISVDATAEAGGTRLSFVVTSQYYFSTFRLEPDNLLERPITSYFQPPYGKKFSKTPVDHLVTDTEQWLQEAGFFNVTVVPNYTFDPTTSLATVVLTADDVKERAKILSIQINGAGQLLSESDIHHALKLSVGSDFNADKLSKGLTRVRQLFVDKGYLTAKVSHDQKYDPVKNGLDVTIEIDPGKPTIVQVFEEGTTKSEISNDKLRTLVPIYEEGTVDPDLVDEGRQHIVTYYQQQGYFDATATAEGPVPDGDSVRVKYVVAKGERHRVRSLRIEGSAFFSEAEILKKMKTREGHSASHGLFSPDLLKTDVLAIKAIYENAGFKSTTVVPQEQESANHDIDITIEIHEGLRSILANITFTGNSSFSEPALWKESGIQSDQVYSAAIIDNARDALASFYLSRGFAEVTIESRLTFDQVDNTVDVQFVVTEGAKYLIGQIFVSGNVRTAEKVISRAHGLRHDNPYNPEEILEAQQRLYALGIFNRVEIVTVEEDLGAYKTLLIQVEEAKTILVTPGFGVTELEPRATIEFSDINLFGLNRTLSVRLRGGQKERQAQTSYRDPRLFNHELQGIASISFDKTDHVFYKSNAVDVSLQVSRKLSKTRTLSFSTSIETVYFQDIRVNPNLRRFPDATGSVRIGRIGSSFIGDHRDSVSDPTHGTFVTSSLDIADRHLGSQVDFASFFTQGSYFRRVPGGVMASSVRVGLKQPYGGDNELPISERFFAGGSGTLRGFKLDDAGPPGGGQLLTIGNLEYRVPLAFFPLKGMGGAVFYDTGNVFERPSDFALAQFTHSAGGGLRYKTPVGPVRVDIGFNLRAKSTDRKYCIFFTLGHAF